MDHLVLGELTALLRNEPDHEVRAFLVEVIWQHRQPSVIPFLGEALRDPQPEVWREALDGLVALASPAALQVLALAANPAPSFREWVNEAIRQVQDQLPSS